MAGRNDAAYLMFFVIGIPSCFVPPCLATGYHAFGFKIATAALRPRNDTKMERFYLENERFCFRRPFSHGITPLKFEIFRSENRSVFPAKPINFVIARRARAPDAAIFDGTFCHSATKYGRTERCSDSHVFCDRDSFLLRAPVLRHGMPCLWL